MEFAKRITLIGKGSQDEVKENWLVFERDVSDQIGNENQYANDNRLTVQIAFRVSDYEPNGRPNIIKLRRSYLNVLFATARDTHLGFLVQGPFRTTPARDNISSKNESDKKFNHRLAEETGELVVEALRWLRDRDWLTIELLQTMPLAYKEREYRYGYRSGRYGYFEFYTEHNRYNDSVFAPVYESVKEALRNEALIPAYGGGYVAANDAKIAGSKGLRDLLDKSKLQQLLDFNEQTQWVHAEIAEGGASNLWRFLTTILDVTEVDAEMFARRIDQEFMSNQSDDWIQRFYEFAPSGSTMQQILRDRPIIRLADGSHVKPFHGTQPQAYLPKDHDIRYPSVKREVCESEKAREFLKSLGLKKPDDVDEVLKYVLPKYKRGQEISDFEHRLDVELIVKAMGVDSHQRKSTLVNALNATSFLWAENTIGDSEFRKPDDIIYFRNSSLEKYFEGNPDGWFIAPDYEEIFDELGRLDLFHGVVFWSREPDASGYVELTDYHGWHERGLSGFDPDFKFHGLEFALQNPNLPRSEYIWNHLLVQYKHKILGLVESCTRKTFVGSRVERQLSKMGMLVRESAWLPDGNGSFAAPSALSLEDLPESFRKDSDLAIALGMQASETSIQDLLGRDDIADDVKRRLELSSEFSVEELELMKEHRNLLDQLRRKDQDSAEPFNPGNIPFELEEEFNPPDNPSPSPPSPPYPTSRTVTDDEMIDTELDLDQEPKLEPLSIGRKRMAKNLETWKFLLDEYGGLCQICASTFEQRNGSPYFAIAHLIQRSKAEVLDNPRNALCLCANHWAQFKYGELKTLDEAIVDQIIDSEEGRPHYIELMLCGERQEITFSSNHISKLRALIEVSLQF